MIAQNPETDAHGQSAPGVEAASRDTAADPAFDAVLEHLMSQVPQAAVSTSGTTWIERPVRNFDLRSAYGGDA